jgi:hypothetical protein
MATTTKRFKVTEKATGRQLEAVLYRMGSLDRELMTTTAKHGWKEVDRVIEEKVPDQQGGLSDKVVVRKFKDKTADYDPARGDHQGGQVCLKNGDWLVLDDPVYALQDDKMRERFLILEEVDGGIAKPDKR